MTAPGNPGRFFSGSHSVVLFCPAGPEQSLGLRIERSPAARLRVRPSRDVPRWGPSLFV